ncbi:hypothetical protein FGE05_05645 [Pseudomonas sp. ICMP22404]|uniref:hypothetical protein n=1 Tax=Pseudomonas sp. ICMP22404 TaxID=2583807 RepID=UPI00111AA177|nr:hypothetical protein [Pseudomonas sp. ICMP22404]TNF84693.1 hypothetical protein FGE05_05645 [Pseudomonas sp. ICMP22404]
MGASLLAKTSAQSISLQADPPLDRQIVLHKAFNKIFPAISLPENETALLAMRAVMDDTKSVPLNKANA